MSSKVIQFAVGLLLGGLASGAAWYFLKPQRDELAALADFNPKLTAEVERGEALKELKKDIEDKEVRIAEFIKMMPLEGERSRVNQIVQKLAQNAGLGRMQESKSSERPLRAQYYSEYETSYRYVCGYHDFGRFLSYVSGFEKIINVSDIAVSRNSNRSDSQPLTIDFKLSVFVYDSKADQAAGQTKRGEGTP